MWQLPKNKPATSTELYITTHKNAFNIAEVLKTYEIQQYIGLFVIAGIVITLYGLCQTRNAGVLGRQEEILKAKKSGGMIIEAVLLEKATLLGRIQYLSCRDHKNVTAGFSAGSLKECYTTI